MGPRVEKMSLRPEVQDFCVQFPVYRLELLHNTQQSYCGVWRRGGWNLLIFIWSFHFTEYTWSKKEKQTNKTKGTKKKEKTITADNIYDRKYLS